MARFIILAVVLAIAFTLYSLVDASMTDARRARGVPKPVWVVICVVLPVIGGILWLMVGKGDGREPAKQVAPDDDPRYGALSTEHVDQRIADLESQLRALDDEVFPGEGAGGGEGAADAAAEPEADAAADEGKDAPSETNKPDEDTER
ncbi:PLDc_N domain-containing protein [Leucobacter sp. UCMA 4100]|uniref:PLD nuclease N-terminal domain-containing protein n=1 Tax=Leucobacter sp. UCMA 4100 TaxID=2810534 RepID=UPI0022EA17C0|nr:PLD nuclease N-terminal domain-containing protein [Leucobacter sp. UCMA 4100]MDA3146595.1 PLDc_N domain-containing protein [Leucobacter sp. UCMA 4100]